MYPVRYYRHVEVLPSCRGTCADPHAKAVVVERARVKCGGPDLQGGSENNEAGRCDDMWKEKWLIWGSSVESVHAL